jgi:hypothetical protein
MHDVHGAHLGTQVVQTDNDAFDLDNCMERVQKRKWPTMLAFRLSAISSIGGFIFGYESGQISGKFLTVSSSHCLPILMAPQVFC